MIITFVSKLKRFKRLSQQSRKQFINDFIYDKSSFSVVNISFQILEKLTEKQFIKLQKVKSELTDK